DIAAAVVDLARLRIRHAVLPALAAPVFPDRLHRAVGLVMRGGQHVGQPAIVLPLVALLPRVEHRREAGHLALLELAVEQGAAHLIEKEPAVDHRPLPNSARVQFTKSRMWLSRRNGAMRSKPALCRRPFDAAMIGAAMRSIG